MKDVAIAYRVYPGVSRTPALHGEDKFALTRFCLLSFREALGGLNFKLWAILDGCPPEYSDLFRSVFTETELVVVETEKIGNLNTFAMQIDLLSAQQEAELIYFAEDDYFYRPSALVEMTEFLKAQEDAAFVTPYDHPDSYSTSSRHERHQVVPFGKRHWRSASSTCLTFLTTRATLQASDRILRSYSRGNMDCSLWLALTQKSALFNPRVHAADTTRLKILVKMWLWGWREILFRKPARLWSPVPTLATHMESLGLAPAVLWKEEFALAEERYKAL